MEMTIFNKKNQKSSDVAVALALSWRYLDHRCGVLRRCMGNRMFGEKTMAMSCVAKWMEPSHPGLDNKLTRRINLNCSELFLLGIDLSRNFIGHSGRKKSN